MEFSSDSMGFSSIGVGGVSSEISLGINLIYS